jgi:hypothetical protein
VLLCKNSPANVCNPGWKRCSGNDLQVCDPEGIKWTTEQVCEYGCDSFKLVCNEQAQQSKIRGSPFVTVALFIMVIAIMVLMYVFYNVSTGGLIKTAKHR